MTVASINTTVTNVVATELGEYNASSYAPAINKVSEALTEREYDIVDAIMHAADDKYGVNPSDVLDILTEAGLTARPAPVVEPEPETEDTVTADDVAAGKRSKAQRIADLEEGQSKILSALQSLTELANRHLNAGL